MASVLFIVFILLVAVLHINLLIAIMTNSYEVSYEYFYVYV
jgi:hypothetical protein